MKKGCRSSWYLGIGGFAATLREGGKGVRQTGVRYQKLELCCQLAHRLCSPQQQMPGLSMGSAVVALMADAYAGSSEICAVGLFCSRRHTCGFPQKTRDRALSTGSNSRWRRRSFFPLKQATVPQSLRTSSARMLLVSIIMLRYPCTS